ncbi:MAG: glycosyltransferase family 4 protein [bacterium]
MTNTPPQPKRILVFSLAYFPHASGAEIAIKEITDRISCEHIAFDLVTLRFDRTSPLVEKIGNVRVYRVAGLPFGGYLNKVLFPLLAAVGAYRLHKKNHYDALWAMMSYMVLPVVLLRTLFQVRLPYVLTLQDGDPFEHVFNRPHILPFRPLLKFGFKNATVVQVISNYLGGWAKKVGCRGQVEVIPNGVDVQKFQRENMGEKIPHPLDCRAGEGVILITTSRLVQKNALDDVIRALVLLPENLQNKTHFKVLGSGAEEANLKKLAHDLGVESCVEFLGNIDNAKVPQYLQAADIFIRPSLTEGMGNSFIEAMAAGLPVIATQEGGIADFLFDAKKNPEHPTTGWAVDKNSPKQIAEAVWDIVQNPEGTKKVVENAQKLAQEKYDWELVVTDMRERVFGRVFARAPKTS